MGKFYPRFTIFFRAKGRKGINYEIWDNEIDKISSKGFLECPTAEFITNEIERMKEYINFLNEE